MWVLWDLSAGFGIGVWFPLFVLSVAAALCPRELMVGMLEGSGQWSVTAKAEEDGQDSAG
jgi:hypothetical protein